MSNDILFISIVIIVILIIVGVFYFWNLASTKPIQYPNNKNVQGIYVSSQINERCSVGPPTTSDQSLLPGYNIPPPCREGYSCIKVREDDAYGYCKANLETKCFTVYDCAPVYGIVQVPILPTGFTGVTGTIDVFCNNVCSTREFGGLLETCGGQTGPFSCDSSLNLICNQLSSPPNGTCFNKIYNPCTDDSQCAGGVCGTTTLPEITGKVCLCPGLNNPINTPVCMYADGEKCRYNQDCYGGTCVIEEGQTSGICRTVYFPGEICRRDVSGIEKCLDGYGCSFKNSPETGAGICQPTIGPTGTNDNPTIPANGAVGALCTSYNVLTGPTGTYIPTREGFPYLSCTGENIECNYNLSTRVPVGFPSYTYLQGYGVCAPALAKIGQQCNETFGCAPPGVCIADDLGQGYCSPPQYIEDEGLTIYINSDISLNALQNTYNHSLLKYIQGLYPSIDIFDYNTMSIQLVGGGGGGGGGNIEAHPNIPGATGYYGGGGGGSGYVKGFLYADSIGFTGISGTTGTFNYSEANDSNIYPSPISVDLTSFAWDDIQLHIGPGGIGGSSVSFTSGNTGTKTQLQFYEVYTISPGVTGLTGTNYNYITEGGQGGKGGSTGANGSGGGGYNGGGAGIGGVSSTTEASGGSGDLLNGGENGFTAIVGGQFESGDGGGLGGGLGGAKFLQLLGTSEGGGGGGGSGVIVQDDNQTILLTGGSGTSSVNNKATIPAIPGFPYTGGGGGGGSIPTNIDTNPAIADGKKGGEGYAIVRFSKVKKDINYAGVQNPTVRVPASGSSGVCANGYVSNGLGQFGQTGAGWCIPKVDYTCNANSYCMNSNNTAVISTGCNILKIGVYIPTPPSLVSSGVNTDYLGQWHFLNFPNTSYSSNARISSYQSVTNGFYPTTKLIYYDGSQIAGQYCNTTSFWYATFSTEDISPNNPQNVLSKTITWNEITIENGSSTFAPLLLDIKFTSAGNIAIFVREEYAINFPFVPGNGSGAPTQREYNRIYIYTLDSTGESTMISTGKLTYTQVTIGPMFCIASPSVTNVTNEVPPISSGDFDDMYFNGYSYFSGGNYYQYPNIIWDVDDLINKSIAVCFKDKNYSSTNSAVIFSADITAGIDTITTLNKAIRVDYDYKPTAIQFYTGSTTNFPAGPQKILYPFYDSVGKRNGITVFTPPSSGPASSSNYQTVLLEGTDKMNAFGFNFNRIIDIGLFDFYLASSGGQFKYTTINTKYQNEILHFSKEEQQIDGYVSDEILNGVVNFLSVGNLDRSMYSIVGTCE